MLAAYFAVCIEKERKMKRVLIGILAVVGLHSAAMAAGAIAVSEEDNRFFFGLVKDYENGIAAGRAALETCKEGGGVNCTVEDRFEDTCAAIAVGDTQDGSAAMAFATHNNEQKAVKIAIASCEEDSENCSKHDSVCDGDILLAEEEADESLELAPEESAKSLELAPEGSDESLAVAPRVSAENLDIPANAEDCAQYVEEYDRTSNSDDGHSSRAVGSWYENICSVAIRVKLRDTIKRNRYGSVDTSEGWPFSKLSPGRKRPIKGYREVRFSDGYIKRHTFEAIDYCYPDIEGGNNPDPCPEE